MDNQEHNDFVSRGTIGDSSKAAAARRNFDQIGLRILAFLNAYLKRDVEARAVRKRHRCAIQASSVH